MASGNANHPRSPMYPKIDMNEVFDNPFAAQTTPSGPPFATQTTPSAPPFATQTTPSAPPVSTEDLLIKVPGAILNLIDKHYSVELAMGDLCIHRLCQDESTVAVLATVSDDIQWPLNKDLAAVKLDSSHYFFSFKPPNDRDSDSDSSDEEKGKKSKKKNQKSASFKKKSASFKKMEENEVLNYGLTILSKGQEADLLMKFDALLECFCNFTVRKVEETAVVGTAVKDVALGELTSAEKKEVVEGQCAAYWTTLAPNVEEYSGTAARLVATGSGKLVKGILWCGDVTAERLNWGNEVLKKRLVPGEQDAELDPSTLRRIQRAKRVTHMTHKVANGVLSGVLKVSGYFSGSVANSKVGKKFFGMLPGEMVLASLDGMSKICDAVEVSGKHVMSTSNTVTTELVSHKYGEEAGTAARDGMDAAGNAFGTAWAVFKLRQALNPKSVLKPTSMAKFADKSSFEKKFKK